MSSSQSEGLEQVVNGIDLIAVDGVFTVGGGEDDDGWCDERPHKVESAEVGHVDIDEDGIDDIFFHELFGFGGTLAFTDEFEERYYLDVCGKLLQCQWFIVDCKDFNHNWSFG